VGDVRLEERPTPRPGPARCCWRSPPWGSAGPTCTTTPTAGSASTWSPGHSCYANTYPAAIELAAALAVDLDALVTGHYPLSDVEDALTAATRDPAAVKSMVVPT
jgi:hypothetical protein